MYAASFPAIAPLTPGKELYSAAVVLDTAAEFAAVPIVAKIACCALTAATKACISEIVAGVLKVFGAALASIAA